MYAAYVRRIRLISVSPTVDRHTCGGLRLVYSEGNVDSRRFAAFIICPLVKRRILKRKNYVMSTCGDISAVRGYIVVVARCYRSGDGITCVNVGSGYCGNAYAYLGYLEDYRGFSRIVVIVADNSCTESVFSGNEACKICNLNVAIPIAELYVNTAYVRNGCEGRIGNSVIAVVYPSGDSGIRQIKRSLGNDELRRGDYLIR